MLIFLPSQERAHAHIIINAASSCPVILYGRYIVPAGHKVFPVRNLEALIVKIGKNVLYFFYFFFFFTVTIKII